MHSLKFIRENLDVLKDSLRKRQSDFEVNPLENLLKKQKELLMEVEVLRAERNNRSEAVAVKKSNKEDFAHLMDEMKTLSAEVKDKEQQLNAMDEELKVILSTIPNILDERVVEGKSDEDNEEIRKVGQSQQFTFKPLEHVDIAEKHGIIDYSRAAKITGARFSYFTGKGAKLHRALVQFFLNENTQRGYEEHFTPYLVHTDSLFTTGQLPKFREDLFFIEGTSWGLIPTAEVSLTNYHRDEILKEEELPKRMTAFSSCFRGEAGASGKYSKGTFRNHQFEKVELVCLSTPEQSEAEHEYMLATAENLLKKLELPYRVMRLCSGDIGFSARMCYDIEVWIPSLSKYMEISSVSNCGSFQATRGQIRYKKADGKNETLHTLNGSSLAVGRAMIAILENYQQADGSVRIPKVLQPYTGFDVIN